MASIHTFKRGLVAALEANQPSEGLIEPDSESSFELPEDLVHTTDEVGELSETMEEVDEVLDSGMDDAQDLERIEGILETAADGEGLSEQGAEMAEVAIEALYQRLGIRRTQILPALERFQPGIDRTTATRVALEEAKSGIREAWDSVIAWLKKQFAALTEFFTKLFSAAIRLQEQAKKLKEKAKAYRGQTPKATTLKAPGVVKTFLFEPNVKSVNAKLVQKHLGYQEVKGSVLVIDILEGIDQFHQQAFKLIKDLGNGKSDITADDLARFFGEVMYKFSQGQIRLDGGESQKEIQIEYGPWVGGKYTIIRTGWFSLKVETETRNSTSNPEAEVEVLSGADMVTLCEEALKLSMSTEGLKKTLDNSNRLMKDFDRQVKELGALFAKKAELGTGERLMLGLYRKALMALVGAYLRLGHQIPALNIQAIKGALEYVTLSMRQYEKAEAPAG
jgi:hypothetical protein